MPRISDSSIHKKFGIALLVALVMIVAVFGVWYYVERSAVIEPQEEIINEVRN